MRPQTKAQWLICFIAALACFIFAPEAFQIETPASAATDAAAPNETITGRVVGITDGDTIKILVDRQQIRVRLWGVDCPESHQAYGTKAKQFTGDLVFGQDVKVIVRDTDRYERTVGEVVLPDGRNLNHELVRAGLAWWYRAYAKGNRQLEALETEARAARRGLWADAAPVEPWEFRRRR